MATFFPLQGFFNASIYLRPRYLRIRSANPDMPRRTALYCTLTCRNEENAVFSRKGSSSRDDRSMNSQASTGASTTLGSFFNLNVESGGNHWASPLSASFVDIFRRRRSTSNSGGSLRHSISTREQACGADRFFNDEKRNSDKGKDKSRQVHCDGIDDDKGNKEVVIVEASKDNQHVHFS
mmetsp:Transcript_51388/g.76859  ORF Transcript_51388/g.76859 Transcript_51388/m.76859 type:complete len:180 (+) Transcript_51388:261-800(+)